MSFQSGLQVHTVEIPAHIRLEEQYAADLAKPRAPVVRRREGDPVLNAEIEALFRDRRERTIADVAVALGRDQNRVAAALKEMASHGRILRDGFDEIRIYSAPSSKGAG